MKEFLEENLPVQTPDLHKMSNPPRNRMQATWMGHSSILVQMGGWNVLADPIFSERCSPVAEYGLGPKRLRPSAIDLKKTAEMLPRIDAIVISHNHFDHLDTQSVKALAELRPAPMWFVTLGTAAWFHALGVKNVVEMDWYADFPPNVHAVLRLLLPIIIPTCVSDALRAFFCTRLLICQRDNCFSSVNFIDDKHASIHLSRSERILLGVISALTSAMMLPTLSSTMSRASTLQEMKWLKHA